MRKCAGGFVCLLSLKKRGGLGTCLNPGTCEGRLSLYDAQVTVFLTKLECDTRALLVRSSKFYEIV